MARILVLNGPNLNLLGTREPGIYGACTLNDIEDMLQHQAEMQSQEIAFFQSNIEGVLVERIHQARDELTDFIIINPAAYTHTSIALRDAFLATQIPFIEVHLSNVYARETFRAKSYLSDIARGVICGLGPVGYKLALQATLEI